MSKMHYFNNKFLKIATAPFKPFNFGDLKFRDLDKLSFFKLIMIKSKFKKIVVTLFQRRHHHYVTEKRH